MFPNLHPLNSFRLQLSDLMCILTEYYKDVMELEDVFEDVLDLYEDIMDGCYGNKTVNKKSVAMMIAAYGGYWVGAFKPEVIGDLVNSEELVVYKGMVYTRDVWEWED